MRSIYACLLFAAATPAAHAAFYVADTPPAAPLVVSTPAAARAPQADDPTVHKIPFAARSSQLSAAAKRALQRILPVAQSVSRVAITGCGEGDDSDVTAYRRGAEIKAWLIANGLSDSAVQVQTGTSAGTVKIGSGYQCLVSFSDAPPVAAPVTPAKPMATTAYTAPTPASAPRATAPAADPRLWMIQSVLEMVSAKALRPEDAIAMLDRIIKAGPSTSAPAAMPAPAAPAPLAAPMMMPVVAVAAPQIVPAMPAEWVLKAGSTLQATLEEWSRQAGWKPPVWRASNPYQVAAGGTLRGDYMEALRQLSRAVPQIDITVGADGRSLVVTDAKAAL